MQDRPHAAELAEAVREFIETEVLPGIDDPRLRFRTLVAANGLGILEREIALGAPLVRREVGSLARLLGHADPLPDDIEELRRRAGDLNRELALRIRTGDIPEDTLAHLLATVADKLRVASPRYLERYNALTGRHLTLASLDYWEIVGNLKWAIGALTQSRRHLSGQQRSVELAVLGRLAAEMEFELLHLLERAG